MEKRPSEEIVNVNQLLFPISKVDIEEECNVENYIAIPKDSPKKIIHSYYIKQNEKNKEILIGFHGNGEFCSNYIELMKKFSNKIKMNILLPEYPDIILVMKIILVKN